MKDSTPPRSGTGNGLLALPGGSYLSDAAQAWRLSSLAVLIIFLFPFMITGFRLFTALLGKESYKWFTGEDDLAENLQAAFYPATLIGSITLICSRAISETGIGAGALLFVDSIFRLTLPLANLSQSV